MERFKKYDIFSEFINNPDIITKSEYDRLNLLLSDITPLNESKIINLLKNIQFLIENTPDKKRLDNDNYTTMRPLLTSKVFVKNIVNITQTNKELIDTFFKLKYKIRCATKSDEKIYNYIFCDDNLLKINSISVNNNTTPFSFINFYASNKYRIGFKLFSYVCLYYKLNNIEIYDLGDSLQKFVAPFNLYNDNWIKKILMSGSIYDNFTVSIPFSPIGKDIIELNTLKESILNTKFDFIENVLFRDILDNLKNNRKVVLIDYGYGGRSLLTLINIFNKLKNKYRFNCKNLIFILFCNNISVFKSYVMPQIKRHGSAPFTILLSDIIKFSFEQTNAEEFGFRSRCTPKFPMELWEKEKHIQIIQKNIYDMEIQNKNDEKNENNKYLYARLKEIYNTPANIVNDHTIKIPNYYLCNLHEIFSILYSHDIIENCIKYCNQYIDNLNDLHSIIFYGFFNDNIIYLDKNDDLSGKKYDNEYEYDDDGEYDDDDEYADFFDVNSGEDTD
jgi:hypothetical protein